MNAPAGAAVVRMLRFVFFFILALAATRPMALAAPGDRSPDGLWLEVDRSVLEGVKVPLPRDFHVYRLDFAALAHVLDTAPPEGRSGGVPMYLPVPDGSYAAVGVELSPVMSPDLAKQYPHVRTFAFRGVEGGAMAGRLTLGGTHFQAVLHTPPGLARVTPIQVGPDTFYLGFLNSLRTDGADEFEHSHNEQDHEPPPPPRAPQVQAHGFGVQGVEIGPTRREYRLAASTTAQYYQMRLGPNGANDVVTSIVAEVNNANAVFEAELAVRLVLNYVIMFTDPNNQPFPDPADACKLRDANPAAVNSVITDADYDIGFAFGSGGGNGCAWYVLCLADKAKGAGLVRSDVDPGGSTGLLAHEMGHQFGAHHTFSGQAGGCTAVEYNPGQGYEPGSGSTIMSYRGSCDTDNVVTTDALPAGMYYNTHSFDEIVTNTTSGSGSTCGTSAATGNSAPAVDAGSDYTIPRGTPFTLTGSATDPDGDPLTYTWEQFDPAAGQRPIDTDTGEGPILRSVEPTGSPSRTFPTLSDILNNTQTKGEILPSTDRTLNFRLTARDDRAGGGGIAYDGAVVTVNGDPFFITSPNGGESFGAGCSLPVTWNVGGGSVASDVSLGFSTNGGTSFDPLVASTANDGAAQAVAPCVNTTQARVKASAIDNVFFDVSNANFSVVPTPPAVSASAMGGAVDDTCHFVVHFSASVADDCSAAAGDVSVQATKLTNNFTMGPVQFNAAQVDGKTVAVTGSVAVSDLTSSPAKLSIKVTGVDACGAAASDTVQVQVVDDTPPTLTVSAYPKLLWPPNHTLRDVHVMATVKDNCPGVGFVLSSATSSEPDEGRGDGNTLADIQNGQIGTPDIDVRLRAERSGGGPGRVYTLSYTATDGSANQTSASTVVTVPHDQ